MADRATYATADNKTKALYDIKLFASLIGFEGGWKNFAPIHNKLAGFVTAPQVAIPCLDEVKKKTHYNNRRLVLMPRGHLKSTVCSVLYTLWRIYRNPNIRILVGCDKLDLAESFIRALRQYFEDPSLQERVWNKRPHISGKLVPEMDIASKKRRDKKAEEEETDAADKKVIWNAKAIQVLRDGVFKEPTVLATSVGVRVTGQHYDLLILDDVVDFDNCASDIKLGKVYEWCQDLESVVDPPRQVIMGGKHTEIVGDEVLVLGTRYDAADYYHHIMDNFNELEYRVFLRNIYRNGQNYLPKHKPEVRKHKLGNAEAGYIWPSKFTPEYVERLKRRTSAKRWSSQYLNTILTEGSNILEPTKVKYYNTTGVEIKDTSVELRIPGEMLPRVIKPYLCVDPAASQSSKADFTVLTVGGVDSERDVFILDTKIGRFTPSQTIDLIYELCEKWRLFSLTVETNGVGATLPFHIKEKFRERRALIINELRSQGNKKERLEARLQPLFENGKLFLPHWLATNQHVQDEITFFPRETAKDDFLDTIDMICQKAIPTPRKMSSTVTRHRTYNKKYGGCR